MTFAERFKQMSPDDFAGLGLHGVAYVKPVEVEGNRAFAIFAADGRRLAIVPTIERAVEALRQHDLEPVTLH